MALSTANAVVSPIWRTLRAVCPACGGMHAHRSRTVCWRDRVLKLAGIRLYRCETCQRQHHGTKWLKTLAPLPQTPGRRSGGGLARWKRRYAAWRLREGRHAHKALMFAVALLAAVSGFFLFLLNSDRWLAG